MKYGLMVLFVAACGSSGGHSPDASAVIDVAMDVPKNDAPIGPPHDAPIDAAFERTTVFLVFDGLTLTHGPDDATQNTFFAIQGTQTVTSFMDDQSDRATRIANITTALQELLAPFDIAIVTTRPSAGPYDLVAFGGASQEIGIANDLSRTIQTVDCDNTIPTSIFVIFGDSAALGPTASADVLASIVVAHLGVVHGIPITTLANDCASQQLPTARCTFHGPGTPVDPDWMVGCSAPSLSTIDVLARFTQTFGAAH